MRIIDMVLSAILFLSAITFLAYIGLYYFEFGLFAVLPEPVVSFFTRNAAIQYVALGLAIVAVIAKIVINRRLRRREERSVIEAGS
ncbi:membrane protein implicated in regulation of membrane protease activity [Microbacterium ginsengiterrae]|uniref:Membrane protein implicated in regulation of membrane protease activity n=1 Tax=Microbacterium ginsengiterrae TaxID=546115 RepID=A0A7W9C9R1_9MICO|nr:hypothetical protein [Microbacterium ginsengiterrae]MBB5741637.1 membrane protein implicated in regulation of membrane protease activity [Microbacterium ginsengiterrae]